MPLERAQQRPLAASQSLIVRSSLPDAMRAPSGENATDAYTVGMPLEGAQQTAARRVPELDRLVRTPRRDAGAVRRERD